MSIELPEAQILAEQMGKELLQKQIESFHLQDYQKLQRIGVLNKDVKAFGGCQSLCSSLEPSLCSIQTSSKTLNTWTVTRQRHSCILPQNLVALYSHNSAVWNP